MARTSANYIPYFLDSTKLLAVFSDKRLADESLTPAQGALLLFLNLALLITLNLSRGMASIVLTGYVTASPSVIRELADANFAKAVAYVGKILPSFSPPESAAKLFDLVLATPSTTWPLAQSNLLLAKGNFMCLDVAGASARLLRNLSFPSVTGSVANARADAFELNVQETIDRSPWKPAPGVHRFRGTTLRAQGKSITDIDAIGSRDGALLLISCKSIPYTLEYDAGHYSTIRNAASTVVDACKYWRQISSFLDENPIGDNYDFSGFAKCVAIVVTPFPVFTADTGALEEVTPGLRMASSANELRNWLHSSVGNT